MLGDLNHQNQSTDIYAIGILLYQCIVGHTPFEGPRQEILQKQLNSKIPLDKIKNKVNIDFDIMIEAKKKDQALFELVDNLKKYDDKIKFIDKTTIKTI